MNRTAFTLIELLLAVSILFVVLAIAVPKTNIFNALLLSRETERLTATFTYLQQRSVASNVVHELVFTPTANSYTHLTAGNKLVTHTLSRMVQFGFIDNAFGPPAQPTHVLTQPVSFKSNKVVFSPDSNISPGTIYLVDQEKRYMRAISSSAEHSSYIRTYRYHNSAWIIDKD